MSRQTIDRVDRVGKPGGKIALSSSMLSYLHLLLKEYQLYYPYQINMSVMCWHWAITKGVLGQCTNRHVSNTVLHMWIWTHSITILHWPYCRSDDTVPCRTLGMYNPQLTRPVLGQLLTYLSSSSPVGH